jgi:hypothetical protein
MKELKTKKVVKSSDNLEIQPNNHHHALQRSTYYSTYSTKYRVIPRSLCLPRFALQEAGMLPRKLECVCTLRKPWYAHRFGSPELSPAPIAQILRFHNLGAAPRLTYSTEPCADHR